MYTSLGVLSFCKPNNSGLMFCWLIKLNGVVFLSIGSFISLFFSLSTVNLLLGGNLGEIHGRILARFWPPGLLLPSENHGENHGRIVLRFWPPGILFLSENLGDFRGRIPARFSPP